MTLPPNDVRNEEKSFEKDGERETATDGHTKSFIYLWVGSLERRFFLANMCSKKL